VVGLGLVWPLLAMRVDDSNMVIHHVRLDVPVDHAAWRGTAPRWEWQPSYLNPQGQFHQTYAGPGGPVALYIEYYRDQKQGAELIDSENVLVPEKYKKWRYLGDVHTAIKLKGKTVRVLQANIDSADVKLLVWQWYWIGGRVVINPYEAKILEAVAKLFGRSTQSAAIIIAADYDFSPDEARPRLARFVTDMYPSIEKAFANEGLQSDIIGSRN
jgi:EpsI family protein